MTLSGITALIASNIDTTGRRLTTGVKMREVLNGIVAYLSGIPDVAWGGVIFQDGAIVTALDEPLSVPQGGEETYGVLLNFSRGNEWGDISVTGNGDAEFTSSSLPSTVVAGSNQLVVSITLDTYASGTYTYDITAGGITHSIIIEVDP